MPEFWQALIPMRQDDAFGVLPRLIETRYGVRIVRVARRACGRLLPFEALREQIRARLARRALQRALHEYAHALVHAPSSATEPRATT